MLWCYKAAANRQPRSAATTRQHGKISTFLKMAPPFHKRRPHLADEIPRVEDTLEGKSVGEQVTTDRDWQWTGAKRSQSRRGARRTKFQKSPPVDILESPSMIVPATYGQRASARCPTAHWKVSFEVSACTFVPVYPRHRDRGRYAVERLAVPTAASTPKTGSQHTPNFRTTNALLFSSRGLSMMKATNYVSRRRRRRCVYSAASTMWCFLTPRLSNSSTRHLCVQRTSARTAVIDIVFRARVLTSPPRPSLSHSRPLPLE